jgi:hypothetical protein
MALKKVVRITLKTILLLISISLSLVSFISIFSTFSILTNTNNIAIDFENVELNINKTNSYTNMNLNFNNTGHYNISNVNFTFGIELENKLTNNSVVILNKTYPTLNLISQQLHNLSLSAINSDFDMTDLNSDLGGVWYDSDNSLILLGFIALKYRIRFLIYMEALYTLDLVKFKMFMNYTMTDEQIGL